MWRLWGETAIPECEVILYTRSGCCLCERVLPLLHQAQQRFQFRLREVDLAHEPDLEAEYGEQIPVVVIDGQVRFRGCVNPVLLTRQLRAIAAKR